LLPMKSPQLVQSIPDGMTTNFALQGINPSSGFDLNSYTAINPSNLLIVPAGSNNSSLQHPHQQFISNFPHNTLQNPQQNDNRFLEFKPDSLHHPNSNLAFNTNPTSHNELSDLQELISSFNNRRWAVSARSNFDYSHISKQVSHPRNRTYMALIDFNDNNIHLINKATVPQIQQVFEATQSQGTWPRKEEQQSTIQNIMNINLPRELPAPQLLPSLPVTFVTPNQSNFVENPMVPKIIQNPLPTSMQSQFFNPNQNFVPNLNMGHAQQFSLINLNPVNNNNHQLNVFGTQDGTFLLGHNLMRK